MYSFESRVRYSETDQNGQLTPLAVINYLQDCSTFQSEDIGVGVRWLAERHSAWFLSGWNIRVDRYPVLSERIRIGTAAYDFRGIYGYRHFCIKDAEDHFCVRADSLWFLCDTETLQPKRTQGEYTAPYLDGEDIPGIALAPMKRKLPLPESMEEIASLRVEQHHLDSNHHVNNAQYVQLALEACGARQPSEIQADYRHAAGLGDPIRILLGRDPDGSRVASLADPTGQPYALVRFR